MGRFCGNTGFWLTIVELMFTTLIFGVGCTLEIYFIPFWFCALFIFPLCLFLFIMVYVCDQDPIIFHIFFLGVAIVFYIIGAILLMISLFVVDEYEHDIDRLLLGILVLIVSFIVIIVMIVDLIIKWAESD